MGAVAVGGVTKGEEPGRGRLLAWLVLAVALASLGYANRIAGGRVDEDVVYQYTFGVSALVQYGVLALLMLWITKGLPKRALLALRRPARPARAAALAAATFVGIYVVAGVLDRFLHAGEEQGLTPGGWDSSRAGAFAFSFVAVAALAPLVEELLYRGLGYALLERFGAVVVIGATGLLFAAAHGLVAGLPVLWFFGSALAWLRRRTGSVYPGIAVHALFNGIALIVSVSV